jgi:hypothetical protein
MDFSSTAPAQRLGTTLCSDILAAVAGLAGASGHGFVWFEFTLVVAGVVGLFAADLTFVEQIA